MDWTGFETHRIELARPLLIVRGTRGLLACGYLNVATFEKTGEAAAIVTGVGDYDAMLGARVVALSPAARELGVEEGMRGEDALERMR